jgi:hypothetical protein
MENGSETAETTTTTTAEQSVVRNSNGGCKTLLSRFSLSLSAAFCFTRRFGSLSLSLGRRRQREKEITTR